MRIRVAGCDGYITPASVMSPSALATRLREAADKARADSGACVSASPVPSPPPLSPQGRGAQEHPPAVELAFDFAWHRVRAGCACSTGSPVRAVRRSRQAAERASAGCRCLFAGTGTYLRKARLRLTDFRPWMGGKRQAGCHFLLATSLLDKQKRSNSRAAGARKLLLGARNVKSEKPPPSALPGSFPRCAGEATLRRGHRQRISAARFPPGR